ncbi:VanW family protein [Peribacillus asahii]|uniref:VanW family protein n=1 Tax=Peribacillus asahii TaxID=228899 RepID=UPI00380F7441
MKKGYVRTLILLISSTLFITCFSQAAVFAYEKAFPPSRIFANGTVIGPINVGNLSEDEAATKLSEAIEIWQNKQGITVSFSDQERTIPAIDMTFLLQESIRSAEDGATNPLYATISKETVRSILIEMAGGEFVSNLDVTKLKSEIERKAGLLGKDGKEIVAIEFLRDNLETKVLARAEMNVTDAEDAASFVKQHATFTIPAFQTVAFMKDVMANDHAFSEAFLTEAASTFYKASLATNLQIIERHRSVEFPSGVEAGYEAKVNQSDLDFIVNNPNDTKLTVTFKLKQQGVLVAEISGYPNGKKYVVRQENPKTYPFKTIVRYTSDPSEPAASPGKQGYSVSVYRDIYDSSREIIDYKLMAKDFYLPVNEVVVKETKEEEVPEVVTEEPAVDNEEQAEDADEETNQDEEVKESEEKEKSPEADEEETDVKK